MHLRLNIEVPASVNHMYRIGYVNKAGRKVLGQFLTDAGREYKQTVGWLVREAVIQQEFAANPKGYYGYTLIVHFPHAGQDLDNTLKLLQDSIFEALGVNDSRVIEIHAIKFVDPDNPRVEVLIYPLTLDNIRNRFASLEEANVSVL